MGPDVVGAERMTTVAGFVVQESVHADHVSIHATREEAVAAIEEMISKGLAEPGKFNIREIDSAGETVRVFGASDRVGGLGEGSASPFETA